MIRQISKEFRDFSALYRRNFFFLKKASVYCTGFTSDDIYEVALYCFFAYNIQSMIDNKVLTQKEIDNKFRTYFRKEVARDNSYGYDFRTNDDLHKIIDKFNTIAEDEIVESNIEDLIIDKITHEKLLEIMPQDELDFCLTYISRGQKYTSSIYGISTPTTRKRYQRYIEKARKKIK